MPSINLLPWREEERKRRQRDFGVAAAAAVVAGILVVVLTVFAYSQMIGAQKARNNRLQAEITELEKSITEIDSLERQKERMLARMEIIDQLQKSRPEMVRLFEELVRQLPDGVYLTSMKQTGSRVELRGVAESNGRVSALMRHIDEESEWLNGSDLVKSETSRSGNSSQSEFIMYATQVRSGDAEEDEV